MASDRINPVDVAEGPTEPGTDGAAMGELRSLLVGPEQRQLAELTRRVDEFEVTAADLASHLPEAIAMRSGKDQKLARALAPTVEGALRESIRRNPRDIATAIFPVLGPAIRKAIAEAMAGLVRSINTAVDHSFSVRGLRWRIESWRSGLPFAEIVLRHALVYRVEQVFLIHADTGLLLAHVAAPGLKVDSADVISGMLTAIQDFTRDSFRPAEGGTLRRFSVGDHTVLVEPGPQALIAAVVRGEPPDALVPRLQDALETAHLQLANPLVEFNGDATPFEVAKPLLASCLETVLTSDRPEVGGSRRPWLRWATPATAVVVGLVGWWLWTGRRWDRAVRRVEAAPGLTIVRAERGLFRSEIAGLRDPLAENPNRIMASLGIDTGSVAARWAPYLSLDSAVVIARAREVLALPSGIAATLRGDTLVLAGEAPVDQLAGLGLARGTPGVSRIEWGEVRLKFPASLDSLGQRLAGQRALFAVGSATLSGSAANTLSAVASWYRTLNQGIGEAGFRVDLEVEGRADPSGSEGINQALSRQRTEAVTTRLIQLGLPERAITATAWGTDNPLELPNVDRAQINRSVSFRLRIRAGSPAGRP